MVNISENLEVLEGVKDDIKTAIENKGIVINDTTPFVDYATKINEISIGTGDYQDGYEQGKLDQKALLENRTFRRNGTYSRPDGYGTVVVDVPSGGTGDYDTGFEDGVAAQKALMTTATFNRNGTYTREDGYNEVVVDVDGDESRYEEGYQDGYYQGEEHQKSLMTTATFTSEGTYTREDGWNEVVVNVENKIPLVNGTKISYSTFTEIPDFYDFSEITDISYMFFNCRNLQTIPELDTSRFTNMESMFRYCSSLQTIPAIDTSNVTNMGYMFAGCRSLQTMPAIDTSNVNGMFDMFNGCVNIQSLPSINCSGIDTTLWGAFGNYFNENMEYLTEVGGWINLKQSWEGSRGLACCPNLTYQSCINILNGLYNFTGNGETPNGAQGKLSVHSNFLTTVGDEINIGVLKGWRISAS